MVSLYVNIAGLRQRPGRMLLGSWKVWIFFCKQESGNREVFFPQLVLSI